jgi:molecular chaperone Hsp33
MDPAEEFTTIESIFVRHRNALLIRGQFTSIYTDYYLHLMQHGIRPPADLDQMLKDGLAMLTLHLVARPWAENDCLDGQFARAADQPFCHGWILR